MKRIVIVGATSGLGFETARACLREGWRVGAAGRRTDALEQLRAEAPDQVEIEPLDITAADAPERLTVLVDKLGGMDIYLHCAGIGHQNPNLDTELEAAVCQTNALGFIRMVSSAFNLLKTRGGGQIAVITSIAGTKGLGISAAYSATKRFQSTYIDALAQLSHMEHLNIRFTDIRPGFVATPMIRGHRYPLVMHPEKVARSMLHALKCHRRRIIIDRRFAALVFLWRLIPARLWERLDIRSRERGLSVEPFP